ncbi:sel1 repeat family protein [Erwinia sp. S59]|nr:sel1 repeat family protein [Erwinia sp. S59]
MSGIPSPGGNSTGQAFTCKHEAIPGPEAEADVLFRYARWLQVNNQLKQDKEVDTEVGCLYRIAAENGHAKATINLQNGSLRGHFGLTASERRRFSQQLIDAGVASGYYFIAIYLQHGAAGLKQDEEMALRYYRKAADEGSALAQVYLAKKLEPVDIAPEVASQMYLCAAEQGEGEAAKIMGIIYKNDKNYLEAVRVYQLGVAAGNSTSASFLKEGFNEPLPDDPISYLGLKKDPERSRRYEAIWNILADYSYAHPTVPEINDIVPLPPAPLPEWDGKLKWLEAREANIPPEKPDDALIARLVKKKYLDQVTGKPLTE